MKPLAEYTRKRNFRQTPEPPAKVPKAKSKKLIFVVQEHHASHLHYDFRLEWNGVLKSWAVPKGPSLDPSQKRLAVEVEDHPIEYAKFVGTIPTNQYGAGEVYRWDMGTWSPTGDVEASLKKGHLEFELKGEKLKGKFRLIRTKRAASKPNWLLMKRHDEFAQEGAKLIPAAGASTAASSTARMKKAKAKTVQAKSVKKKSVDHPEFIPPQLAQLVDRPPKGDDWVHEIKFDGYRIQCHIENAKITLYTRRGLDWTSKYSAIVKALKKLKVENAVFDGEVVWQDEEGRSNFQKLQNAMKFNKTGDLVYWIFDLLHLDGEDLTSLPLIARKERLEKLIRKLDHDQIRYSEHHRGIGEEMIEASCQMNLEGIISKRVDTPYASGRHDDWVKVKCVKRQEFVIGGFTDPEGSRFAFGSLLLGVYENEQLRYVGRCGSGFDHSLLRDINKKLRSREIEESPFVLNGPKGRGLHWVKPELVCEVSFSEFTEGGHLRTPVFKGLRADKPARQIGVEKPKHVKGKKVVKSKSEKPAVSSPDRVVFTKEGITKLVVANYYQAVSSWLLPHIIDRPLSLVRCPENSTKPCFFSKHFKQSLPEHVIEIPEEGNDPWITVENEQGLIQLIQWGTLEIHPWNTHRPHIENPDQIVMDFDPDEEVDFEVVKEGAFEMRDLLKQLGLRSFVKATGGKGLHVQFPFQPLYDWDSVKSFAKSITQEFVSRHPDLYTGNMSKKTRKGKIFLDYLRNGRGSTAVAPYSLRAKATSSVAMPLSWEELDKLKASNLYSMSKALQWLKKRKTDPWKDYFRVQQKIALLA